jgi:hypothetical protein
LNDVRNRYCGHCKLFHEEEQAPLIDCVLYIFQPGVAEPDIITILDPGVEPSERDLRRMDMISEELLAFEEEMRGRIAGAKGSA